MKKILLLITTFFVYHFTMGQTIFNESFDGTTFPPTGWTNMEIDGGGTTSIWTRVTSGSNPTCTTHSGAGMASYNCYDISSGKAAILASPAINLTSVGSNVANISFWMYRDDEYDSNYDSVDVYVNNTIAIAGAVHLGKINRYLGFAPVEAANGWYKYTFDIPASFNGATNYFVFKATSDYGNDIYIDDVAIKISAPNDAGIISIDAPASITTAGLHNVDVTIKNFGSANLNSAKIVWTVNGITQTSYVWGSNLATGATDGPITVGSYSFTTGINTVKVWSENPNGAADGDHTNDTTTKVVFVQGYASLPFIENFDGTWLNKLGTRDVPTTYWINTPVSGNNSWRRDDDGTSASWSGTSGAYSPTGASGTTHSARFHSYDAYPSGITGLLDLYLDFTTAGTKILKFWYINTSGDDSLGVYISHDGGSTYNFLQEFLTSATWTSQQISLGAATDANTILRFKATSDDGLSDIGLDGVEVTILQPNDAGVASIDGPNSPVSGVTTVKATIKNFGYSLLTSATINWSVNGVTQTPYSYANGPGLPTNLTDAAIAIGTYDFSTAGFYTLKVWTSSPNGSSDGDHSNDTLSKVVYKQGYASLPYTENFDGNWINKSSLNDAPSLYWNNTPALGNNSWRRDDEGATGSWAGLTYGGFSPAGASGTAHSARFHSYDVPSDTTGIFDLYLDFSLAGSKVLQFWYNNVDGDDSLDVYLSTDNGTTFNHLFHDTTATSWTQISLPLGSSTGTNTILRFKATSDYGASDIGIDEVLVYIPTNNDVGVSGILSPKNSMCGNIADSVTVLVHNYGLVAQGAIPVNAIINGIGGQQSIFSVFLTGPLAPGATDTLYLGTINTLIPFVYTVKAYTALTTDNVFSNDTAYSTFTITSPLAIPHTEDFEGATPLANWNTNFYTGTGHGNTSSVLYRNLWSSVPSASAIMTKKIGPVTANSFLTFDYRITNYTGGTATVLGKDTMVVFISADCGDSYIPVYLIDSTTHVPSTTMKHVVIPIGTLAGSDVLPKIYAQRGTTGDYYVDFDNITISDAPVVNLGHDTTLCAGHNLTLNAGAGMDSYLWSGGQTTPTITVDTTGIGLGTFTYFVHVTKGLFTVSDTIKVTFTSCVGLIENNGNISVSLVPNPTTGITNLSVTGINKPADITIYSLLGQLMYADKINGNTTSRIDLSHLPKGVYLVRIFNEETNSLRKLVIQ